jgi:hypothetical protein
VLRARVLGITVTGSNVIVLDNRLIDTVGCQGIYAFAAAKSIVLVNGNVIHGLDCTSGTPSGIVVTGSGRALVQGNRLDGLGTAGVTAQSFGVLISSAASVSVPALVDDNHFYLMNSTSLVPVVKTSTAQKGRCSGNLSPGYTATSTGCL